MQEVIDQLQKVDTIEEAEQFLFSLIKTGKNYREILKIKFLINGKTIGFNVSKLNKIKDRFEGKKYLQNRDPDKSLVFKYFKQGMSVVEVVIETNLNYEYVKTSYEEFLESEKMTAVPNYWLDNLQGDAWYIMDEVDMSKLTHIQNAMSAAKDSHLELANYVFNCVGCGEQVRIIDNALKAAQDFLSGRWGHKDCI